jgi:hypothetical protein
MQVFYQSFLLRIWKNSTQNNEDWHASLEDSATHQITNFNQPDQLLSFLLEKSEYRNPYPEIKDGDKKKEE